MLKGETTASKKVCKFLFCSLLKVLTNMVLILFLVYCFCNYIDYTFCNFGPSLKYTYELFYFVTVSKNVMSENFWRIC